MDFKTCNYLHLTAWIDWQGTGYMTYLQHNMYSMYSMYSLNSIGFCYPGLNTSSKVHLYKTICHPTLSYGMDSLNVKNKCIKQLESTQGCVIKQVCGLNKRAHHSSLLRALDVESVKTCIDKVTLFYTNVYVLLILQPVIYVYLCHVIICLKIY